jgi:SecD/SecF fusion protein
VERKAHNDELVGYSINDTIVTFDRIRENLARRRPGSFSFASHPFFISLR